jgi:O-acetyl-ADP-ribose deacetylase (regulator of RNase III)
MQAQVNDVTIVLTGESPFSLAADALAIEADHGLRLPAQLLEAVGFAVQQELAAAGRVASGEVVVTSGGASPFATLIHVVTPRWGEGSERGKLMNATRDCLLAADEAGAARLNLPAFSVGERGFPVESCAAIMLTELIDVTFEDLQALRAVHLCCPNAAVLDTFSAEFERQLRKLADEA